MKRYTLFIFQTPEHVIYIKAVLINKIKMCMKSKMYVKRPYCN